MQPESDRIDLMVEEQKGTQERAADDFVENRPSNNALDPDVETKIVDREEERISESHQTIVNPFEEHGLTEAKEIEREMEAACVRATSVLN